ncbi:MAG TPA: hypothetical protein VJ183_05295 [Chloroflexia bacterium]|nr:hypothetical protein [Chloroflexia bacterium]
MNIFSVTLEQSTLIMLGAALAAGLLLGLMLGIFLSNSAGRRKRRKERQVMMQRLRQIIEYSGVTSTSSNPTASLQTVIGLAGSAMEYLFSTELDDRTGAKLPDPSLINMPGSLPNSPPGANVPGRSP